MPSKEASELAQRPTDDGSRVVVTDTTKLSGPLVKSVQLDFKSGSGPTDMIKQVSEQFATSPIKSDWSEEIRKASTTRMEYLPGVFFKGKYVPVTGGPICDWELGDYTHLRLSLELPATNDWPNEYELKMTSDKVDFAEQEAERKRNDDAAEKAKRTNPNPKF